MMEAMASENVEDMGCVPVYYDGIGDDGNLVFALLADEVMVATIPRTAYDELAPAPVGNPDRDYFIDWGWAIENCSMMVKHQAKEKASVPTRERKPDYRIYSPVPPVALPGGMPKQYQAVLNGTKTQVQKPVPATPTRWR